MQNLLPITVIASIVIFSAKEIIELCRRSKERERKKRAIKSLIRDELLTNHLALVQIFRAIDMAEATPLYENASDTIVSGHDGRTFYRSVDGNGEVVSGILIRSASLTEYQRLLPQAAELDFELYRTLREAYSRIHELSHIITSFIEHAGVVQDDKIWFQSFREWASGCLPGISEAIVDFYDTLGGDKSDIRIPPRLKVSAANGKEG